MTHAFHVSLSFAGEQRTYAIELERQLKARGLKVFYDESFRSDLWGSNVPEKFHQVYAKESQVVLMLISREYCEKVWCRLECRAAVSTAIRKVG